MLPEVDRLDVSLGTCLLVYKTSNTPTKAIN